MKATISALALALATALPGIAAAADLKPLHAGTFVLGDHTVSVFYTVSGDTYEVVTTVVPDALTSGSPVRFVGFLPPGQKQVVSVGSVGTASSPDTLELIHQGDLLSATLVPGEITG
jgi:hypothetical protein